MKTSLNNTNYVYSGGICIKVLIESVDLNTKVFQSDFFSKYIPNLEIKNESVYYDAYIVFENKDIFFNFSEYPSVKVGASHLSEKDVISLIELVLERARQEKGIYCIHSSTVIYKDKAIIFWGGATGMGKTRLAKLFIDNGAYFYSDEKTLLDLNTLEVTGGIPFQYLDKTYWKKQRTISAESRDPYLKVKIETLKNSYPISFLVYGFGIDGAELSLDKWEPAKLEWHLYEELSRKIRAVSRRVLHGQVSVPSLDNQKNADNRIILVGRATKDIDCYSIQGTVESVISKVTELAG